MRRGRRDEVARALDHRWLRQAEQLLHTPSAFSESAFVLSSRAEDRRCVLHDVSSLDECVLLEKTVPTPAERDDAKEL